MRILRTSLIFGLALTLSATAFVVIPSSADADINREENEVTVSNNVRNNNFCRWANRIHERINGAETGAAEGAGTNAACDRTHAVLYTWPASQYPGYLNTDTVTQAGDTARAIEFGNNEAWAMNGCQKANFAGWTCFLSFQNDYDHLNRCVQGCQNFDDDN